jgi:hypothetical protein
VFPPEALELRDDYAGRLAKLLSLPAPPRVYLIAAVKPDQFDLPALAAAMSQEKTTTVVKESRRLAGRRREASMLAWLDAQDLPGRAKRLGRLLDDAQELSAQRLGVPIVESSIPAIVADPAYRLMMTDGVLSARVARWPLVSLVHTLLAPLNYVVRENVAGGDLPGARGIVDGHLRGQSTGAAELVQTTFAQLHQTQPLIAELYRNRRLWEPMHASAAAADLRTMLADTTERQRASIMTRLAGRRGLISPLIRWLLTIGAALWFPIGQPVLEAMLEPTRARTARDVGLIAVHILGVTPLLESAAFLMIYFLALWAWIKWDTNRRVSGLLSRWKTGDHPDPSLNFTTQTLQWVDGLLEPIRVQQQRLESLARRMTDLRKTLADGKTAETEAA